MTAQLQLYSIPALIDLQAALSRFQSDVQDGLSAADAEVGRVTAHIEHALVTRQRQLEDARRMVQECEAALQACLNSGYVDPYGRYLPPDCRREEAALAEARHHVRTCEERLETAMAWRSRIEEGVSRFQQQARRMSDLSGDYTRQVQAELGGLAARYAAVHRASGAGYTGAPAPSRATPTGGKGAAGEAEWVERGIRAVPVGDLPDVEGVAGSQDFSKVSEAEMRAGLERLQEMQPDIDSGIGASSDYWASVDRSRGLDYSSGYQRVYDAFHGSGAIRVERVGDSYNVVNGRHRIWLARQMGIAALPMRVIEKG